MKTPISPALVRSLLTNSLDCSPQETMDRDAMLAVHIRAVAAEMRQESKRLNGLALESDDADLLMPQAIRMADFADKLEGVE